MVQLQAMLDTYASKYHDLKAPRKLKWKPALGSVTLTIKVGSDTLDVTVTPLHATIIMHFQVTVSSSASSVCRAVQCYVIKRMTNKQADLLYAAVPRAKP